MKKEIDKMKKLGDTLGGEIEVVTTELPPGLGDYAQWDKRLDSKLAQVLLSIPAIKGMEIGPARENSSLPGSKVHDQIYYEESQGYYRKNNRAGGIEGGVTNGLPLKLRMMMKPLPTLYKPLQTVDMDSKEQVEAAVERADVTALPAAGVVGEAMVMYILSRELLIKFGGDNIEETIDNYKNYLDKVDNM